MCRSTGVSTQVSDPIQFGSYNIRNIWSEGLDSSFRGVSQANLELVVSQENGIMGIVYTRGSDGYSAVGIDASIQHRSRVAVLYWPPPRYAVDAIQQFRPNYVGFQIDMGDKRWYIIRCYLAPDNTLTIESIFTALKEPPDGIENSGDRIPKRKLGAAWGRSERVGYIGGVDGSGIGGNVGPLPPATAPLVPGQEDVDHGQVGG